jgi:hypothetical protein
MGDQRTDRGGGKMPRIGIPVAIACVLTLLAIPVVGFIFLMASPGLGGLAIVAALVAIQFPLMYALVVRKK